jgi:hypothetical protein
MTRGLGVLLVEGSGGAHIRVGTGSNRRTLLLLLLLLLLLADCRRTARDPGHSSRRRRGRRLLLLLLQLLTLPLNGDQALRDRQLLIFNGGEWCRRA